MALPWPPELIAEARRLWDDKGLTASQVVHVLAREHSFSVSRSAICGLAHRQGWTARKSQLDRTLPPKRSRAKAERALAPISAQRGLIRGSPPRNIPAAKPDPSPTLPEPDRQGVLFVDHREGQCRWPLWTASERDVRRKRFCGEPIAGAGPYCAWCHSKSVTPKEIAA